MGGDLNVRPGQEYEGWGLPVQLNDHSRDIAEARSVPILAPDSTTKSQAIWCSVNASLSWRDWMLKGSTPAAAQPCATPIERNLSLGRAHRIDGVPALIFDDGSRAPGLISAALIEQRMTRNATP